MVLGYSSFGERGVFLRTRRGQAIGEKELIDARLTREKISEGRGALLAFVGGVVTACALDLNEFADNDAVAHDRVERWLDNARALPAKRTMMRW